MEVETMSLESTTNKSFLYFLFLSSIYSGILCGAVLPAGLLGLIKGYNHN